MTKLQFAVLCGFLLFQTTIATCQSLEELVDTKNWPDVKTKSAQIVKTEPKDAFAHYAYALALFNENPQDDQIIEHLEKALKFDPALLDAYRVVAQVYLQKTTGNDAENSKRAERWLKKAVEQDSSFVQAWLDLARLIEHDLRYDASVEILRHGVLKNPTSFDLYDAFRKKSAWYKKFEEAYPVLDFLCDNIEYNHPYIIQKADFLFQQGDNKSSLALLNSLQESIYKDTKARFYLLRAKILFEDFQDEDGLQNYWKAVSSIVDSADAKQFIDDVCYIMLSNEYNEFKKLSRQEYGDFFTRFCRSRDPNLATRENERIPEHFRRLFYTRQNFRRFTAKRYNETILEQEHYHAGATDLSSGRTSTARNATSGAWIKRGTEVKVGDDFMDSMVSDAIFENRDLDDLGLIYVKHGQWDDWETATIDQYNVIENKTVQYYQKGSRPEMLFHFVKNGEVRGWCIESLPHYYINRGRFGSDYARIERYAEMNRRSQEFEFEEHILNDRLIEQTTHDAQVAVTTETADYEPPGQAIALPHQFLCFKDEDIIRLEWYYLLMGDRIGMESDGEINRFNYSKSISLFDADWNEVLNEQRDEALPTDLETETWNQSSYVRREQLFIPPGTYFCQTQITDNVLENTASHRDTLRIPDYFADSLSMSDILLSKTIMPATEESQQVIHDLEINPHMFWAFDKKEPIGIYFEVYNLTPSGSGKTKFDVTCTIVQKEQKTSLLKKLLSRRRKNVSIVNQYEGTFEDEHIYINFNLEKQKKGMHDLIVHITDLQSNLEIEKSIEIDLY